MKQISLAVIIALALLSWGVSAATGTGTTSTGAVLKDCTNGAPCAGGPSRAWNYSLNKLDMLPQCFPWVFASQYFVMDISSMYENQTACRENRARDFHW